MPLYSIAAGELRILPYKGKRPQITPIGAENKGPIFGKVPLNFSALCFTRISIAKYVNKKPCFSVLAEVSFYSELPAQEVGRF